MDGPMKIDLTIVARDLRLPPEKIEKTVELLDAGNTIPFITRFRKDLTGGLNEQQILAIKQRVAQLRALAERKSFVLRSIESQGKLTDELSTQINKSTTSRRLEDLYLPFKPKKQSRASLARQQGLEPLAEDIFLATSPDVEIATRATEFVRVDKGLTSVDDVIKGVGDLMAERFSENDELRCALRKLMWTDGKLVSHTTAIPEKTAEPTPPKSQSKLGEPTTEQAKTEPKTESIHSQPGTTGTISAETEPVDKTSGHASFVDVASENQITVAPNIADTNAPTKECEDSPPGADDAAKETHQAKLPKAASDSSHPGELKPVSEDVDKTDSDNSDANARNSTSSTDDSSTDSLSGSTSDESPKKDSPSNDTAGADSDSETTGIKNDSTETSTVATREVKKSIDSEGGSPDSSTTQPTPSEDPVSAENVTIATPEDGGAGVTESKSGSSATAPTVTSAKPKKKKRKKKKKPAEDPFKDYKDFKQPIRQVPNHRILAINRGERAGSLKVRIIVDGDKLHETSNAALVPAEHPFREFMLKCANDALNRLIIPSLEREIRRELTETAEKHAVEVFANNLRNLLLQPPIRNRTVLAIDPGFKRGCSVAVLDPCGDVLDSGHVFVVGNQTRRDESKQKIANWVKTHKIDVIAIGNGAACRQTEQMVSDTIAEQLQELQTTYVMVNEAGASIYSTSEIGRSELPNATPSIRSAISIGRRLQDPLSELVKISPANIGVGMYQHDVKAKHLSESLDEVVRFCVNQVGVDVNTASPSLLKYVSGLNSLTARRVVEHRQDKGQFSNRNQLKEVSGFGDATFVQAAGFLRIHGGDTPLDATSIHPESYEIANHVLQLIDVPVAELFPKESPTVSPKSDRTPSTAIKTSSVKDDLSKDSLPNSDSDNPAESDPDKVVTDEVPANVDTTTDSTSAGQTIAKDKDPSAETPTGDLPAVVEMDTAAIGKATKEPTQNAVAPLSSQVEIGSVDTAATDPVAVDSVPVESVPAKPDNRFQNSNKRKQILKKIGELDVELIAQQHSAGKLLIKDILMALKRPKWDPRDKISKPIFRRGIIKADDLQPSMQLDAQVVNVVDFGVFVDIGLGESSLVHVSQLSNQFIRDPHRFYSVGDVLKVWVSEIDSERRRVKLTAIRPGSKRPPSRRDRKTGAKGSSGSRSSGHSGEGRGGNARTHKPGKYGNKFGGGRPKGKPGQQRSHGKGSSHKSHVRRSKPKEVKPITDGMLKGSEPMRSFSDLAQFVSKKPKDSQDAKESKEKKSDKD